MSTIIVGKIKPTIPVDEIYGGTGNSSYSTKLIIVIITK